MSKYIVDIPDGVEWGVVTCRTEDGFYTRDFDSLEELNSDYINEHFSDLQDDAYNKGYAQCQDDYSDALKHAKDTAYKKGLHDGESKCGYCNEYQRGLDDAWEAARKISVIELNGGLAGKELMKIYGTMDIHKIYDDNTASEAIAKLKAYEKKQSDKIEVGDIVERYLDDELDSTGIYLGDADEKGDYWNCLFWTGASYITLGYPKYQFKKTGRHFDIQSILEGMRK